MHPKVFGLSCIENQILSLLYDNNQPIECLYFDCAIPLCDLFNYLVVNNVPFYEFNLITRIQDVLKMLGIIEMKLHQVTFAQMKRLLSSCNKIHFLIRVNKNFVINRLHKRNFREDHFVKVERSENLYKITNDIPNISFIINENELIDAYDGQIFLVRICRSIGYDDIEYLKCHRVFKAEEIYYKNHKNVAIDNISRIVDLVVVYNILRHRMREYYKVAFIDEHFETIENLRAKSQYCVLRGDKKGISEIYNQLNDIEQSVWGDFLELRRNSSADN